MVELIKGWAKAIRPHLPRLGWSAASGLLGSGIGLGVASLYLRYRGW
jgi:hypothetical protein